MTKKEMIETLKKEVENYWEDTEYWRDYCERKGLDTEKEYLFLKSRIQWLTLLDLLKDLEIIK